MLINIEGRFMARVTSHGVTATKKKGLPQFEVDLAITQMLAGGEWMDIQDRAYHCRHWMVLINGDGAPNEINIESITNALGWDAKSFKGLEESDFKGAEVQITTVKEPDLEGNERIRVKYFSPRDYEGGVKKLEASEIKGLDAKFGAKLRAIASKFSPKEIKTSDAPPPAKEGPPPAKPGVMLGALVGSEEFIQKWMLGRNAVRYSQMLRRLELNGMNRWKQRVRMKVNLLMRTGPIFTFTFLMKVTFLFEKLTPVG